MQEKPKNQELNHKEKRNIRQFDKEAGKFPYLMREIDIFIHGWKSQEPLKNLRILRNLLALLLSLVSFWRYESHRLDLWLFVSLGFVSLSLLNPLFEKLSEFELRIFGEGGRRGSLSGSILIIIFIFGFVIYWGSFIQPFTPGNFQSDIFETLTTLFAIVWCVFSPIMTIFALMGVWHIGQVVLLIGDYLRKRAN